VLQPGNRYFWKIAISICTTASYRGFEKWPISWLFFSTRQCSVVLLKWCLDNAATKVTKCSLMQVIKGITMALSLHFRSTTLYGAYAENQKGAIFSPIHAISRRLLVRRRTKGRKQQ